MAVTTDAGTPGGRPLRATVIGETPLVVEVTEQESSADPGAGTRPLPPSFAERAAGQRRYEVVVAGWRFEVVVESAARARLRERANRAVGRAGPAARASIAALIPGRVVAVEIQAGDRVEAGQRLLSVEAMKMENEIRAPRAGTIERVSVRPGERVEVGTELVVIG